MLEGLGSLPIAALTGHVDQAVYRLVQNLNMIDASIRLRRAITVGDVALVRRIIRISPNLLKNPDFEDKANTSLHLAAKLGFTDIAALLVDAGHEKDDISWNSDHETPLMLAARNAKVDVAEFLIEAFPHCIKYVNKEGMDALAMSCQNAAATALVPVILSKGDATTLPHTRDYEGNTPLHHASASGSLKALRILLAAGADPLAKNTHDWTPLAYSQTVAAEVYFKNLVGEFERKRVEGVRMSEERERQRAAGLRMIQDEPYPDQIGIAIGDDNLDSDPQPRWI